MASDHRSGPRTTGRAAIPLEIASALRRRLRRAASPSSVPGSLPVLFFGDLPNAWIATVGLNPSRQEYLDRSGRELMGSSRRFETLSSLGALTRNSMTDGQADRAIDTMRAYFQPGKPVYSWFGHLNRVVASLGAEYGTGRAAHLDLVQEATDPTWSLLAQHRPEEASALMSADLPFLRWEIETYPLKLVLCNGRSVFDHVVKVLGAAVVETGTAKRATWWIAKAIAGGRAVGVGGWNMPLVRPTGLDSTAEAVLGSTLGTAARSAGVEF